MRCQWCGGLIRDRRPSAGCPARPLGDERDAPCEVRQTSEPIPLPRALADRIARAKKDARRRLRSRR